MVMLASRKGLVDWFVQRVTAILIGAYAIFLILYLLLHPRLDYAAWRGLYSGSWMRIITIIILVSILWHAWIGMWTVFTDYVKIKPIRLLLEVIVILLFLAYLIWMLEILWF
jgi:succinate dehydrogenase / fumarate reductase membrane anchor subunit